MGQETMESIFIYKIIDTKHTDQVINRRMQNLPLVKFALGREQRIAPPKISMLYDFYNVCSTNVLKYSPYFSPHFHDFLGLHYTF